MNKRTLIQESWKRFEELVIPNVSDVQRREMRKAYFAGASVIFTIVIDNLPDDDNDTSMFDGIQAEINEFGLSLDAEVLGKLKPLGDG